MGEWGESANKDRVLVFNYEEHFKVNKTYDVYLIGKTNEMDDVVLNLLKTTMFVDPFTQHTTERKLWEDLEFLNVKYNKQLKFEATCTMHSSCTYAEFKAKCDEEPYCQNPELSMAYGHQIYKVLQISHSRTITNLKSQQDFIACLCAKFDLENLKVLSEDSRKTLACVKDAQKHWCAMRSASSSSDSYVSLGSSSL